MYAPRTSAPTWWPTGATDLGLRQGRVRQAEEGYTAATTVALVSSAQGVNASWGAAADDAERGRGLKAVEVQAMPPTPPDVTRGWVARSSWSKTSSRAIDQRAGHAVAGRGPVRTWRSAHGAVGRRDGVLPPYPLLPAGRGRLQAVSPAGEGSCCRIGCRPADGCCVCARTKAIYPFSRCGGRRQIPAAGGMADAVFEIEYARPALGAFKKVTVNARFVPRTRPAPTGPVRPEQPGHHPEQDGRPEASAEPHCRQAATGAVRGGS